MRLETVTAPTVEPVTAQEAYDFLRIDQEDDASLIEDVLIPGVRKAAEAYTGCAFITQTLRVTVDTPDVRPGIALPYRTSGDYRVSLPRSPIQSVTSVIAVLEDGTTETVSSADYYATEDEIVFLNALPARRARQGLRITYVAGFGASAASVPADVRLGFLKSLATVYDNRMDYVIGTIVARLPQDSYSFFDSVKRITL
jgi:uncharacterized phiE125 gp8 family phage protein